MRNPFPDNEVFKQFLGLKDYFRKYQTKASYSRIREIATIARILYQSGENIAFDFLGSVNFGMAQDHSDVDLVLYLECEETDEEINGKNCPRFAKIQNLMHSLLSHELKESKYLIEIVDVINLTTLDKAIKNNDYEHDLIARFIFYRTICRGVNKKVLHPLEKKIIEKSDLFHKIEESLTNALIEFTRTSTHGASFKKYIKRLEEKNIHIPASILEKVVEYLDISKDLDI